MIYKIARKEFIETLRDKRFLVSALIVGGLLLAALALGWQHSSQVRRQHEAAQELTRQQWLNQGAKGPHSAAHYGVYAFKPQMPLSFVDRGVESYTGAAVWLEAHKQNDFRYRPAQDQTAVARFGELTAATVLQILLPLLIILLAFTAFAGERESGTLRQVLSLGIRPSQLAAGKVLGIAGVLALLLAPAVIIGVAALTLAADNGETAPSIPRMALLTVSYLLYLGIFVAISLAVSARVSSSRLALLLLLGFWIVGCLIAPRVATDIARRIYPTPSAFEFTRAMETDIKNGVDGHNASDRRTEELKIQTMQKYGVSRLEDLPVNFAGLSLQASEDYGNQVFDKHYGSLWDAFILQDKVRQWSAVFTPLLAASSLSRGLAGTDFAQHRDFAAAAENHRRMLIRVINEDVSQNSRYGDTTYTAGADLWAKVPEFKYAAPGTAWVVKQQIGSLVILALWFAVSVLVMLWAVSRMKAQ